MILLGEMMKNIILLRGLVSLCICSVIIGACSKQPTPISHPTESPETLAATIDPIKVTASPIPTEANTSTSTPSPTPTSLPANTYPLNLEPWPESGDLLLPIDVEVFFETSLEELETGDYIVILDSREHAVRYASLSSGESGDLLRISPEAPLPRLFVWNQDRFILAEPGEHWRIYDLVDQRAWRIGPVCASYFGSAFSPGGNWIGVECSKFEKANTTRQHVVIEVISLEMGKGYDIVIPRDDYIYISWLDEDSLITSEVQVSEKSRNCGLHFSEGIMYCPPSITSDFYILSRRVTRSSFYIPMIGRYMNPREGILVPKVCFENGEQCTDIIDLGPIEGHLYLSPEGNVLAWIEQVEDPKLTNIGVFEPPEWEARKIAQFKSDISDYHYRFVTWCPDENCLIVSKIGSAFANYRINLDATYQHLPYEEVIGSFSIP
jgi:hypothetical protein